VLLRDRGEYISMWLLKKLTRPTRINERRSTTPTTPSSDFGTAQHDPAAVDNYQYQHQHEHTVEPYLEPSLDPHFYSAIATDTSPSVYNNGTQNLSSISTALPCPGQGWSPYNAVNPLLLTMRDAIPSPEIGTYQSPFLEKSQVSDGAGPSHSGHLEYNQVVGLPGAGSYGFTTGELNSGTRLYPRRKLPANH